MRPATIPAVTYAFFGTMLGTGFLLLSGCAHMEAPPGGPPDTHKPYVTAAFPPPDTTRAPLDLRAQVVFSEWINPDIERNKVYLNPPLARKLKTKLKGNVLEVTSKARLDTGTTYTLGILGSVKDLNGLPLESPLALTFATGAKLDSGSVSGRLTPFQAKPTLGAFAALYPRDADLRARFSHLTRKGDSAVTPDAAPNPAKERPAYLGPVDSLGRFAIHGVRPGRYALLGFQDINGNLNPEVGTEALAIGPTLEVTAKTDAKALTLFAYDTLPIKIVEARWVHEAERNGKSEGTIRIKFSRQPNPLLAVHRESYEVATAKNPTVTPDQKAPADPASLRPVLDACVHPVTGEIELHLAGLDFDSEYVVRCPGLRDVYGNALDSTRGQAAFKVGRALDTTRAEFFFFGPRKISGEPERLAPDKIIPGRGLAAYYPRLLSDSILTDLKSRLIAKSDTTVVKVNLLRADHHEIAFQFPGLQLKGQRLTLSLKPSPTDTGKHASAPTSTLPPTSAVPPAAPGSSPGTPAPPTLAVPPTAPGSTPGTSAPSTPGIAGATATAAPANANPPLPTSQPIATLPLADSAKLGSLKFRQSPSAFGSRLILRALSSTMEFSRQTPTTEEFTFDSLPEGWYAVDYFRDANGDGIWNPGSLAPWNVQEPYVEWADSVEVKPGSVGDGMGKPAGKPAGDSLRVGQGTSLESNSGTSPTKTSAASAGLEPAHATTANPPGSATNPLSAPAPAPSGASAADRKLAWPPAW